MTTTKGNLQRAQIFEVDDSGEKKGGGIVVNCTFNPYEYTVSKSNSYSEKAKNNGDTPQVTFSKAGAQTLKLNLIFDTYEEKTDVSIITNKLWKLMETRTRGEGQNTEKIPPPEVAFSWGVFHFVAVITNMTQKFTLFTKDGIPVRAKVDVTFTQHKDLNDYRNQKQNPTSGGGPIEERRQVIAGDRLDAIAAHVYGDPNKWRLIAERNNIINPLTLRPGQYLIIPED
ncbi:MAG: LysM peptidoglycan-binding domain-containing protein [Anaerolineaceae bacterium]|nr:LysM peptidoglycan-binding domain-containing protein [Anaerolineaceae bacterium]